MKLNYFEEENPAFLWMFDQITINYYCDECPLTMQQIKYREYRIRFCYQTYSAFSQN